MRSLLLKEINAFFSSLSGYLVLFIFFTVSALFLFVFHTPYNIFDYGYAGLEPFFSLAPFIFLFLIPAIGMKSIAEERKTGMMEVLLTKPIKDSSFILAKFFANVLLSLLSLLPIILYYYTVYQLGSPKGNLDSGAFLGALCGLFFLASCFAAIALWASSLTDNQIIAFVLALAVSAFMYMGWEMIASLNFWGRMDLFIQNMGIESHYTSISRGVIDIRDIVYYVTVISIFLSLSGLAISRNKNYKLYWLGLIVLVFINVSASFFSFRFDATSDKRYSLQEVSKEILRNADRPVFIKVYLSGDLPSGFIRLQKSLRENLEEFKIYHRDIRYQFIDPYEIENEEQRQELFTSLYKKGMHPTRLEVKTKEGFHQKYIFPYAEINIGEDFTISKLLVEQYSLTAEEALNNSIQNIELQLISSIRTLLSKEVKKIGIVQNKGCLASDRTLNAAYRLSEFYGIRKHHIDTNFSSLFIKDSIQGGYKAKYHLLLLPQPKEAFSEQEKFLIDQYVMYGGRILWLIDGNTASLDSLKGVDYITSQPMETGLDDLFFRYGVRIHKNLVLDYHAAKVPIIQSYMAGQPITHLMPLFYLPLLVNPFNGVYDASEKSGQMILSGIRIVKTEFPSSLDTIENDIRKTILLRTSPYTKLQSLPSPVSMEIVSENPSSRDFRSGEQNIAVLLEGQFRSLYQRRRVEIDLPEDFRIKESSGENKMIFISDGDMIKNDLHYTQHYPMPLGFDQFSKQMYDNADFILNTAHYLNDEEALIQLKERKFVIRLLDKSRVEEETSFWRLLNLGLPNLLLCVFAFIFYIVRKKRYA